jgi:hypothetical protein
MRRRRAIALALTAAIALASCGGGGDDNTGSAIFDGYGPGNPSACPKAALADVWLDRRIACLAAGQKFVRNGGATGPTADRAYIFGQQVLNASLANVLGPNVLRYFKHAVCVRGAPENLAPITLAVDLEVAVGLNVLANGTSFYPPGVSGSTFWYGGIADTNTLQITCSPLLHPIIVDYSTGRIEGVNAGAVAALQIFDR